MKKESIVLYAILGIVLASSGIVDLSQLGLGAEVDEMGAVCEADDETAVWVRAYKSVVPSTGVEQGVAITESGSDDGAFLMQGSEIIDVITSNTSGFAVFDKKIPCGEVFSVMIGKTGASGYYYHNSPKFTAVKVTSKVTMKGTDAIKEVGTLNYSAKASTTGDYTTPGSPMLLTLSHGGGWTEILDYQIAENSGKVYRAPAACFDYNTTAISNVEFVNGKKITVPITYSGKEECWAWSLDDSFELANYAKAFASLKIVGRTTSHANNSVDVYMFDLGNYLLNGVIKPGYEDYDSADVMGAAANGPLKIYTTSG